MNNDITIPGGWTKICQGTYGPHGEVFVRFFDGFAEDGEDAKNQLKLEAVDVDVFCIKDGSWRNAIDFHLSPHLAINLCRDGWIILLRYCPSFFQRDLTCFTGIFIAWGRQHIRREGPPDIGPMFQPNLANMAAPRVPSLSPSSKVELAKSQTLTVKLFMCSLIYVYFRVTGSPPNVQLWSCPLDSEISIQREHMRTRGSFKRVDKKRSGTPQFLWEKRRGRRWTDNFCLSQ